MFKNNVFNPSVSTVNWFKKAGIRAIKTFAQTMASMITVGAAVNELEWGYIASVALVSGIYSIVTSVAGIPEAEASEA